MREMWEALPCQELYLAATAANLTPMAGGIGLSGRTGSGSNSWGASCKEATPSAFHFLPVPFAQIVKPVLLALTVFLKCISPAKAFQPDF